MMVGREISDERAGNYCGDPEDVILEVNNVRGPFSAGHQLQAAAG